MKLLTATAIADIVGVSRSTVSEWIWGGELEATNIAATLLRPPIWRVRPEALDRFLASRSNHKAAQQYRAGVLPVGLTP